MTAPSRRRLRRGCLAWLAAAPAPSGCRGEPLLSVEHWQRVGSVGALLDALLRRLPPSEGAPGVEQVGFLDEELNVRPAAERHAACNFTVLDADAEGFEQILREIVKEKPVLVKNLLRKWTALDSWTPEWYAAFVNNARSGRNDTHWSSRKREAVDASPWLDTPSDLQFDRRSAQGLGAGPPSIPNALVFDATFDCTDDPHLEREAPLPDVFSGEACSNRHVAFNALGEGRGLHRQSTFWQAQVAGNKSWYLMPRRVGGYIWETTSDVFSFGFPHEEQPLKAGTICGYRPVRDIYKDNLHFCVQGPGEVVVVPNFWWHATCTLDEFNVATGGGLNLHVEDHSELQARAPRIPVGFLATGTPPPQPTVRPPGRGVMQHAVLFLSGAHSSDEPSTKDTVWVEPWQHVGSVGALLDAVLRRLPPSEGAPGVEQVFGAIDGYCWEEQWMFHLGDVKGSIVDRVVEEWVRRRAGTRPDGPVRGVEYGSFVGYSAMRVARHLPPGSEFVCVEPDYEKDSFRTVVDRILSLAEMDKVVKFRAGDSYDAIDAFVAEGAAFDVVTLDHGSRDFLPTLQKMISLGQLQVNGLFLAYSVVAFNIVDLLAYLRFSGAFVDYRLYYTAVEYDDFHGQPNAEGDYYPDGVVSAVYAGPGRGRRFESSSIECLRFRDCSACLANLCAWCVAHDRGLCVADSHSRIADGCPRRDYTMIGLSSGNVRCPNSTLAPMSWVGPEDLFGRLRWHRVPGGRWNTSIHGQREAV